VVLRAGAEEGREALTQLCRDYWYPLYAFLRRRGLSPHDAQDVTQSFFLHAIENRLLGRASAEKGRFRSYLLGALQNFLANEQRRAQTLKRGGRETIVAIDELDAEQRLALEPADRITPELCFERDWAFALLDRVLTRLRADYERSGRAVLCEKLQPYLAGKAQLAGYAELGRELAMSESAVAVAIHRMRRRYGELLREEIAHTVESPEMVDAEVAHLLAVVARV
jgi:RNA polymerase sigma-70 factor (ECF subfamily)